MSFLSTVAEGASEVARGAGRGAGEVVRAGAPLAWSGLSPLLAPLLPFLLLYLAFSAIF